MKKPIPTIETYTGLQEAYDFYNEHLFNGRLPNCIITYQRQNNSYGYHCGKRWGNGSGDKTDEIAMNPAYFATRPIEETLGTFSHELCHLRQAYEGTPGRGGYHNKEFAEMMREIGLIAYSVDNPEKEVGDRVSHRIDPNGLFAEKTKILLSSGFSFPWVDLDFRGSHSSGGLDLSEIEKIKTFGVEIDLSGGTKEKPKSGVRVKYTCPNDHYSVWGKSGIDPKCGTCDQYMIEG